MKTCLVLHLSLFNKWPNTWQLWIIRFLKRKKKKKRKRWHTFCLQEGKTDDHTPIWNLIAFWGWYDKNAIKPLHYCIHLQCSDLHRIFIIDFMIAFHLLTASLCPQACCELCLQCWKIMYIGFKWHSHGPVCKTKTRSLNTLWNRG